MYGVISCKTYWQYINDVIVTRNENVLYQTVDCDVDIQYELDKATRVHLETIIIDTSCLVDLIELPRAIRRYRIKCDKTRIIILASDLEPGNNEMSLLVQMGVYDIIPINSNDDQADISTLLMNNIENPYKYAKAVRWDIGASDNDSEDGPKVSPKASMPNNIVPTVEVVKKYTFLGKNLIGVMNLSPFAGSTFITINLAKAIADLNIPVAVIETPMNNSNIYDTIGVNMHMEENEFHCFAKTIDEDGSVPKDKECLIEGVYWYINDPEMKIDESSEWDSFKMLKLINASRKASINLLDIGNEFNHQAMSDLIMDLELLLVVVDPLPGAVMQSREVFEKLKVLKDEGVNVQFVFNKWNSGVDKRKILEYFALSPITYVPFVIPELVYKAIYDCHIPYGVKKIKEILEPSYMPIIKAIVPEDLLLRKGSKSTKKGFFGFMNKEGGGL